MKIESTLGPDNDSEESKATDGIGCLWVCLGIALIILALNAHVIIKAFK